MSEHGFRKMRGDSGVHSMAPYRTLDEYDYKCNDAVEASETPSTPIGIQAGNTEMSRINEIRRQFVASAGVAPGTSAQATQPAAPLVGNRTVGYNGDARMSWPSNSRRVAFVSLPICAIMLLSLSAESYAGQESSDDGFTPLFNGDDLSGWEGNTDFFRVDDGAIIAGRLTEPIPRNEFLCTEDRFEDFELRLQVKASQVNVNGGIQIRSERVPDNHEVSGYQVDTGTISAAVARRLTDPSTANEAHIPESGTAILWGSLYDESRRNRLLQVADQKTIVEAVKPEDWNDFIIRCEGPRIQVWVNGVRTVDYTETDSEISSTGIIGLQIHSGPPVEISYRNIRIKLL